MKTIGKLSLSLLGRMIPRVEGEVFVAIPLRTEEGLGEVRTINLTEGVAIRRSLLPCVGLRI